MADIVTLLAAVSANGTGPVIDAGDLKDEIGIQVEKDAGVTAFSVLVEGSLDGVNWFNVGSSPVTAVTSETMVSGILARYFRATLSGYTGTGTLTAKLAFAKS